MIPLLTLAVVLLPSSRSVLVRFKPSVGTHLTTHTKRTSFEVGTRDENRVAEEFKISTIVTGNKAGFITTRNEVKSFSNGAASSESEVVGRKIEMTYNSLYEPVKTKAIDEGYLTQTLLHQIPTLTSRFAFPNDPVHLGSVWGRKLDPDVLVKKALPTASAVPGGKVAIQSKVVSLTNTKIQISLQLDGEFSADIKGTKVVTKLWSRGVMTVRLSDGVPLYTKLDSNTRTTIAQHSDVKQIVHVESTTH